MKGVRRAGDTPLVELLETLEPGHQGILRLAAVDRLNPAIAYPAEITTPALIARNRKEMAGRDLLVDEIENGHQFRSLLFPAGSVKHDAPEATLSGRVIVLRR